MNRPPTHVSHVGVKIFVDYTDREKIGDLEKLGFERDFESDGIDRFSKKVSEGNVLLANEFSALRNAGIAFAEGKDWSPAAIFEEFRSEGLLAGSFQKLTLSNPNCPVDWFIQTSK